MSNDKFLQLENIYKTFPLPNGKEYKAVVDVNVNIKKNEIVSIIGHSGCGKSTLLNMIAGLDSQTSGHIILNNKEITGPGPERAVVFQNHSLLPWLSVYQNIEMAVKKVMPHLSSQELRQRVEHFVSMVNLDHAKDKFPGGISGGMKQRVGIARALSIKPDVLLMDEPFGALDEITRMQMQQWLLDIWEKYKHTIVFVTHSIDEAIYLSDRVYVLSPRPAKIKCQMEINLPRPRLSTMLTEKNFSEYKKKLLDELAN